MHECILEDIVSNYILSYEISQTCRHLSVSTLFQRFWPILSVFSEFCHFSASKSAWKMWDFYCFLLLFIAFLLLFIAFLLLFIAFYCFLLLFSCEATLRATHVFLSFFLSFFLSLCHHFLKLCRFLYKAVKETQEMSRDIT